MIELARLFTEAGFPNGVVNVVTGLGPEVGEALVTHPAVAHIGFTGGSAAGRKIYELAARNFKTVTLELGGKSPNIVFDDADLEQAVKGVVSGIFAATGPELPGRIAAAGAALDPRQLRRQAGRLHEGRQARRPDRGRHADRAGRDAAAVREGALVHRDRQGRRRGLRPRRQEPARPRRRPLRRADDLHRRQQQHADRPGGSVRPGARGDSRSRTRPTRSRSATTSPTAWPPRCGRATCAAP